MTLPVLFDGYMMMCDIGNDTPAPYLPPLDNASTFREAYSKFIKLSEVEARGIIARDHVQYLSDLTDEALADLETWEPAAFIMKVTVDHRGDIRIVKDGSEITLEDIYAEKPIPEELQNSIPTKVKHDDDLDSSAVTFATAFIESRLTQRDAKLLFTRILYTALTEHYPAFTDSFLKWLGPDGGTVVLRDELCRPYKSLFDDRKVEGRQNLVWDNAWTHIDSAKHAYNEEFRVGVLSKKPTAVVDDETYSPGPRM